MSSVYINKAYSKNEQGSNTLVEGEESLGRITTSKGLEESPSPQQEQEQSGESVVVLVEGDKKPEEQIKSKSVLSFDGERYTDILVRLEVLKNLDISRMPRDGAFIVRISCKDKTLGHFPSGDLSYESLTPRSEVSTDFEEEEEMSPQRSPDIFLNQDIEFCVKFKEIVDNPIVFHLCPGEDDMKLEDLDKLPAVGYICLNIANLLNFNIGSMQNHIEPWIFPPGGAINEAISGRPPLLQLSVECIDGFPCPDQLVQGNMMTFFCESMYNLSPSLESYVSSVENQAEIQAHFSLPYSKTESVLTFPGGSYKDRDNILLEPVFRKSYKVDEMTQTTDGGDITKKPSETFASESEIAAVEPRSNEPVHWASVKENFPEVPLEATSMSADDPFMANLGNGTCNDSGLFGDSHDNFQQFSESNQSRVVWSSIHRKYLSQESYRNLLSRLSLNATWPIEIIVAIKKDRQRKKSKRDVLSTRQSLIEDSKSQDANTSAEESVVAEAKASGLDVYLQNYTLVYHGIAFVDLSCLTLPGMKSARFACKLVPFSKQLLLSKTCVQDSVVSDMLLKSMKSKFSLESNRSMASRFSISKAASEVAPERRKSVDVATRRTSSKQQNAKSASYVGVEGGGVNATVDTNPFIVFRIAMRYPIVHCYKDMDISKVVSGKLSKRREPTQKKLFTASKTQQKYRRAVLEAASELSHEFSEHYWKDVLQNGDEYEKEENSSNAKMTNEALKNGLIFYLNASGRYLVLREHLRTAISTMVQQRCVNLRPNGFQNHSEFQNFLHDMHVYLVKEMNEILSSVTAQETDPLMVNTTRLLQKRACSGEDSSPASKLARHNRLMTELALFSEEALAQGDIESCQKLQLQRICKENESANAYADFAIMWLSLGEDRKAEMAAQEALQKDPYHIYALIISGVISVQREKVKGMDFLMAALAQKPLSPELNVIVGLAHSLLGNVVAADYFFQRAAYIHRTVTGASTTDVNQLYTTVEPQESQSLAQMSESVDAFDREKRRQDEKERVAAELAAAVAAEQRRKSISEKREKKERRRKIAEERRNSFYSQKKSARGADGVVEGATSRLKEDSPAGANDNPNPPVDTTSSSTQKKKSFSSGVTSKPTPESQPSTKKASNMSPTQTFKGPVFSFTDTLKDINNEELELPPFTPSIQSPWDVTEFNKTMSKHLKTLYYLSGNKLVESSTSYSTTNMIPDKDGIVSDQALRQEYDKIVNNLDSSTTTPKSTRSVGRRSSGKFEEDEEEGQGDQPMSRRSSNKSSTKKAHSESATTSAKQKNRLGSELIWAANLLLNLRLLDFLDGILAKHLLVYKLRTVQYVYLRALSLYLRFREEEALPLVKEVIEMDTQNGVFWTLKGHCHYVMGNVEGAMQSYETALKLPQMNENRHLLYLRYGSILLHNNEQSKLAKMVFLLGAAKYPTPYMWLALGNVCLQRKEYSEAESSFSEANRLDNMNPVTWGQLALTSLLQEKRTLAEQSYKWAIHFGLRQGPLLEEIQRLQKEKGYGDPSFPRIPNCISRESFGIVDDPNLSLSVYNEWMNMGPPQMTTKSQYNTATDESMGEWHGEYGDEGRLSRHGSLFHADLDTAMENEEENSFMIPPLAEPLPTPPPTPRTKATKSKIKKTKSKSKSKKKMKKTQNTSMEPSIVTLKNPPPLTK